MVKDVLGKSAPGDVADLQLQAIVLAGRIGQRKGAPPAVALLADSDAITPSGMPVPNSSGCFEALRAWS